MKIKFSILTLLLSVSTLFAQNTNRFDARFKNADEQHIAGNCFAALPMYIDLYKMDTLNSNICYLVGDCYLKARSGKAKAIPYLEKAVLSISPNYK